ncbi:MAG: hypothetical protein ACYCU7_19295 [Acidimicrobiales bacterium]
MAAVEARAVEAQARGVLEQLQTPVPLGDPVEELLLQASLARQWQELLMARMSELSNFASTDVLGIERARALVGLFTDALDRTIRVLTALGKLDLQARKVQVDEARAIALVSCVHAALARAEIAEPGRQRFVEALSSELKALEPGNPLRPA